MKALLRNGPLAWSLVALAIAALLVVASHLPPSTYRAAALLKLEALPDSVQNVECWSQGWEDDLTQCIGTADLQDLPALMGGWPFEATEHCERIPNEARDTPNRCYQYVTNEPREGGYVKFSFAEATRWFHATIFRP